MDSNVDYFRDLITLIGVVAAIWGGFLAYQTFIKNNKQKRFEFFYGIFNKYLDDPRTKGLQKLFDAEERIYKKPNNYTLTEEDKQNLKLLEEFPIIDKYYFLGLIEQVAIALNSKLIDEKVALHMFGYYALFSYNSKHFWANNMQREKEDSKYWGVYKSFVEKMKKLELNFPNPNEIKF